MNKCEDSTVLCVFVLLLHCYFLICLFFLNNQDVTEVQTFGFNLRGLANNMVFLIQELQQFDAEIFGRLTQIEFHM